MPQLPALPVAQPTYSVGLVRSSLVFFGEMLGQVAASCEQAEQAKAVRTTRQAFGDAVAMVDSMHALLGPEGGVNFPELRTFLQRFVSKLERLRHNEILVCPGGWSNAAATSAKGDAGCHVVLFVVRRCATTDTFTFSVCNAGGPVGASAGTGMEYHPHRMRTAANGQERVMSVSVSGIPAMRLRDASFWYLLLRPLMGGYGENETKSKGGDAGEWGGAHIVYERLLPYLRSAADEKAKAIPGMEAAPAVGESKAGGGGGAADAAERVAEMSVRELKKTIADAGLSHDDCFEKPELRVRAAAALEEVAGGRGKSGGESWGPPPVSPDSCFAHCVVECARECLSLVGGGPEKAASVQLLVHWAMLRVARADLATARARPSASDVVVIDHACRQLARHAVHSTLGPLDKQELLADIAQVDTKIAEVRKHVAATGRNESIPPQIGDTLDGGAWAACYPLFGRLRKDVSVEPLAGGSKSVPIMLPVQLSLVPDHVASYGDVSVALRHCLNICMLLANQRHLPMMKNTYCHRVVVIQHLFTRVVPIPLPVDHPDRATNCFWASHGHGDGGMRRETQSEILRLLHMICRHFVTAALSMTTTPQHDAVRILVVAAIVTVADAVVRIRAVDIPSEFSLHYSGQAEGPVQPFGFELGGFAAESELLLLSSPDLHAVRAQILAYHRTLGAKPRGGGGRSGAGGSGGSKQDRAESSPQALSSPSPSSSSSSSAQAGPGGHSGLRPDHVLFRFEHSMGFGPAEAQLLHQVCLSTGFSYTDPVDPKAATPEEGGAAAGRSILVRYMIGEDPSLLDMFPEIACFRDTVFLLKALLAPAADTLPDHREWEPNDAILDWSFKAKKAPKSGNDACVVPGAFVVKGFGMKLDYSNLEGPDGVASPDGKKKKGFFKNLFSSGGSKRRAPPSQADPSNLIGERVESEEDILHLKNLPDFDGTMGAHDAELLLSYLLVPYVRIPLVLGLFADSERIMAFKSPQLRAVIEASLFEPGLWRPPVSRAEGAEVPEVSPSIPAPEGASHLATPCGLLFNELRVSPDACLNAIETLLNLALEMDPGRFRESPAPVILFVMRMAVRVEGFVMYLINHTHNRKAQRASGGGAAGDVPGLLVTNNVNLARLVQSQRRLRYILDRQVVPMLERWVERALRDSQVGHACTTFAHLAYVYKNAGFNVKAAATNGTPRGTPNSGTGGDGGSPRSPRSSGGGGGGGGRGPGGGGGGVRGRMRQLPYYAFRRTFT